MLNLTSSEFYYEGHLTTATFFQTDSYEFRFIAQVAYESQDSEEETENDFFYLAATVFKQAKGRRGSLFIKEVEFDTDELRDEFESLAGKNDDVIVTQVNFNDGEELSQEEVDLAKRKFSRVMISEHEIIKQAAVRALIS